MANAYVLLENLEVYRRARDLSRFSWVIYEVFDFRVKKIMGDQFIRSSDSVGANIAEGYGRFYYLDKVRFYYQARGHFLRASIGWSYCGKRYCKPGCCKGRIFLL